MASRIIAVSGIRDLLPEAIPFVQRVVLEEAHNAAELRFGGALGVDTVALLAVRKLPIRRVVYVPFALADQPKEAQRAIGRCATQVIELGLPQAKASYLERTRKMLTGVDRLLAGTDGRTTGGTAYAIQYARLQRIECRQIPCLARRATDKPRQTLLPLGTDKN